MFNLYDIYKSIYTVTFADDWQYTIDYVKDKTIENFGLILNDNYCALLLTCVVKYNEEVELLKSQKYDLPIDDYVKRMEMLSFHFLQHPLTNIGIITFLTTDLYDRQWNN